MNAIEVTGLRKSYGPIHAVRGIDLSIPLDRDFGAIKRLRGTPMPATSYFIGKAILVSVSMVIQILMLFAFGLLFFAVEVPTGTDKWLTFAWLVIGVFFSLRKFKWDRD